MFFEKFLLVSLLSNSDTGASYTLEYDFDSENIPKYLLFLHLVVFLIFSQESKTPIKIKSLLGNSSRPPMFLKFKRKYLKKRGPKSASGGGCQNFCQ